MADDGGALVGGCCGALCYGIFGQFFSTRTWGTGWTCWDQCCRCNACWDAGEFDPSDRPGASVDGTPAGAAVPTYKQPDEGTTTDTAPGAAGEAPPPAYKAAEPMKTSSGTPATDAVTAAGQTGAV